MVIALRSLRMKFLREDFQRNILGSIYNFVEMLFIIAYIIVQ